MRFGSSRTRGAGLCLVAVMALTGCFGGTSGGGSEEGEDANGAGPEARSGRALQLTGPEPAQGFDPAIAAADSSRIRMGYMFAKLLEYTEEGEVVGALAEEWEVSEDGTQYTFTLRDTAMFSDGSPVTADDVVFSLEYIEASETMGGSLPDITSLTAVDEKTVEVVLAAPAGRQLELALLREGNAGIVSRAAVEAAGGPEEYFANPTATSGPFVLEEYLPAASMTFAANEHFWREGYPKSEGLVITFQDDVPAQLAALETGTADIVPVAYESVESMTASGQYELYSVESLAPTFWGLNKSAPPFDNQQVRQAFAYAVDREGPRSACWFGTGGVSYGNVLLSNSPYYVETHPYEIEREEAFATAGKLLDEAGWVDQGGQRVADGVDGVADGTRLSVTVPFEANWPAAECNTVILQQTFAEIGVEIVPEAYDPAAFYTDVGAGEMTMWHGGAASPNAESYFADWFHSEGLLTPLTTQLDDPAIDAQVDEALTTPDLDRAAEIFKDLEQYQIDQVPMIVIGYQWQTEATTPALQDYWVSQDAGSRPLVEAWIDE